MTQSLQTADTMTRFQALASSSFLRLTHTGQHHLERAWMNLDLNDTVKPD
jgi:hypothetical protein